jgi:hypothetical protein
MAAVADELALHARQPMTVINNQAYAADSVRGMETS